MCGAGHRMSSRVKLSVLAGMVCNVNVTSRDYAHANAFMR